MGWEKFNKFDQCGILTMYFHVTWTNWAVSWWCIWGRAATPSWRDRTWRASPTLRSLSCVAPMTSLPPGTSWSRRHPGIEEHLPISFLKELLKIERTAIYSRARPLPKCRTVEIEAAARLSRFRPLSKCKAFEIVTVTKLSGHRLWCRHDKSESSQQPSFKVKWVFQEFVKYLR